MTHEELRSRITTLRFHDDSIALSNALRAVVELHKPVDIQGYLLCKNCSIYNYPCETIQVIKKELQ